MAQFELLTWIADGCAEGVYEGTSHRVSARALHNRGLVLVEGQGKNWAATITPKGTKLLEEHAARIEAARERQLREEVARAESERKRQERRKHAVEMLEAVVAAGGRLELGPDVESHRVAEIADLLARERLLPPEQRLAQEPTLMDPVLGVTVYLEPDFAALTSPRAIEVPQQIRDPHPAVDVFRDKRAYVSKPQIARAARILQALVSAALEMGWKVPAKAASTYTGREEAGADLSLKLPSQEIVVTVRELDERGRGGRAFTSDTDYYTREQRTRANRNFVGSGRLELTLTKAWEQQPILTLRDTREHTLDEQLPTLIRTLEIAEKEAEWKRKEEARRSKIRELRWEQVKKAAFVELAYERNAEQLRDQLTQRDAAAAMRDYADEIVARAARLEPSDAQAAHEWADWIRRHAERTDPIYGPLAVLRVESCGHEELQPHMNGWSTHGPFRR
ncbi:hypothetical protein ACTD5D_31720 [Nocardia takedensis]|uniref:hypothetical protein n=1 Tax=Nocardia takedensis TaxID=259390 RepID=UPI001FE21571|nr:hypothetical protein [Nocardia takedensis]